MTAEIISIAQRRGQWTGAYGEPRRTRPKTDAQRAADLKRALDIWDHARLIVGTDGERYLQSRNLLPDVVLNGPHGWPSDIRWADDADRHPDFKPRSGIVVAVREPATGEICGIHRMYFRYGRIATRSDGTKDRRCLGNVWRHAVTFSTDPDPNGTWGITEGVENALAARQLYRFPVWSAVFGGNMSAIEPPAWARRITIYADHDPINPRLGYRPGFKFAASALHLWRRRPGVESVRVLAPDREGADIADILQEVPYDSAS